MSSAWGLMKFKDTGTILIGAYNGTCDVMYPKMFKPEECVDGEGYYTPITKAENWIDDHMTELEPYTEDEVSDVILYTDYGTGMYWVGKGVERCGIVLTCDPFRVDYTDYPDHQPITIDVHDGTPDWVEEFMNSLE